MGSGSVEASPDTLLVENGQVYQCELRPPVSPTPPPDPCQSKKWERGWARTKGGFRGGEKVRSRPWQGVGGPPKAPQHAQSAPFASLAAPCTHVTPRWRKTPRPQPKWPDPLLAAESHPRGTSPRTTPSRGVFRGALSPYGGPRYQWAPQPHGPGSDFWGGGRRANRGIFGQGPGLRHATWGLEGCSFHPRGSLFDLGCG
jgi:hypothetical protein